MTEDMPKYGTKEYAKTMVEKSDVTGKDLEKYEARQPTKATPANKSLLEMVIAKGADLQTIEKFMDLQERHEKNEARKAFVVAMAEFKKNPPEIIKDMKVEFDLSTGGKTSYTHASLANVTAVVSTELSKYGLSGRWDVDQGDFGIKVTFILTHTSGHSEKVSMVAPPDNSGKKNPIQSIASTVSYLERYTMLAGTGLAAKGMDNDGNLPDEEPEPINQDQINEIKQLIIETETDESKFCVYLDKMFGKSEIKHLNKDDAEQAIAALKEKKNANNN